MQPELNNTANTTIRSNTGIVWPKWINKVAWFLRITGLLILVASAAAIIQSVWPHSLRDSVSLQGLLNGTTLFVMSFIYVTTGRTRNIISTAAMLLAVSVIVFALAKLGLPHL